MSQETAGGRLLRFPLERRLAAMADEAEAENALEAHAGVEGAIPGVEYVQAPGWFGVRLRPETT